MIQGEESMEWIEWIRSCADDKLAYFEVGILVNVYVGMNNV